VIEFIKILDLMKISYEHKKRTEKMAGMTVLETLNHDEVTYKISK